jgi:hypothetical protein
MERAFLYAMQDVLKQKMSMATIKICLDFMSSIQLVASFTLRTPGFG